MELPATSNISLKKNKKQLSLRENRVLGLKNRPSDNVSEVVADRLTDHIRFAFFIGNPHSALKWKLRKRILQFPLFAILDSFSLPLALRVFCIYLMVLNLLFNDYKK